MRTFLILLLLFPLIANAQLIFPESLLWSTLNSDGGGCNDEGSTSYYTKILGDSTISGTVYRKVLKSKDPQMLNWSINGYIREQGQKVFFRATASEAECLLYDFGCSVGDTLNLNCWCPDDYFTYSKVDSIISKPINGQARKHYYLSTLDSISMYIWIEGIGSTGGLLNSGGNCMLGFHEMLLCCQNNGSLLYKAGECNCFLTTNGVDPIVSQPTEKPLFNVVLSPVANELQIEMLQNPSSRCACKIISANGSVVRSLNIEKRASISTTDFVPGIYFVTLSYNGKSQTEKVVLAPGKR